MATLGRGVVKHVPTEGGDYAHTVCDVVDWPVLEFTPGDDALHRRGMARTRRKTAGGRVSEQRTRKYKSQVKVFRDYVT